MQVGKWGAGEGVGYKWGSGVQVVWDTGGDMGYRWRCGVQVVMWGRVRMWDASRDVGVQERKWGAEVSHC